MDRIVSGLDNDTLAGPRMPVHRAATTTGLLPSGEIVRWVRDSPVMSSLTRGETLRIPELSASIADHLADQLATPALAEFLRSGSAVLIPLMAGSTLLGGALLVNGPGRAACDDNALAVAEELTRLTSERIDAGQRHGPELILGQELRYGALPRVPDGLNGVELAFRYLPRRHDLLGGDCFDAFSLPSGRTALVIGDVAGHGARVAFLMSQCRTVARTLATFDLTPDGFLDRFDRMV